MKPNRILQIIALGIGFLFLYIPIVSLVVYSFNESQLVTVWTRFFDALVCRAAARRRIDRGGVVVVADWLVDGVCVGVYRHVGRVCAGADGAVSRVHACIPG